MKIKTGDNVIVISGSRKDKNKQGKVLKTFVQNSTVVVEGINVKKKVVRDAQGKKSMVDVAFPVHVSNVALYDDSAKKGTRVGYTRSNGKKVRIAKASGSELK